MKINGIFDFSKSVGNASGNNRYVVIHKGTAFPTSPTPQEGQLFYRTDLDTFYIVPLIVVSISIVPHL